MINPFLGWMHGIRGLPRLKSLEKQDGICVALIIYIEIKVFVRCYISS